MAFSVSVPAMAVITAGSASKMVLFYLQFTGVAMAEMGYMQLQFQSSVVKTDGAMAIKSLTKF